MKFETVKGLDEEKFRRLTGVKRTIFEKMTGILEQATKYRESRKRAIEYNTDGELLCGNSRSMRTRGSFCYQQKHRSSLFKKTLF